MATQSPVYFFQIVPMCPAPARAQNIDHYGVWSPPKSLYSNVQIFQEPEHYFYCDGKTIRSTTHKPEETELFKTSSVYHTRGRFFHVNFDATRHAIGDGIDANNDRIRPDQFRGTWEDLHFEHEDSDCSSVATYGGDQPQLRAQRLGQSWVDMLLPECYHAPGNRFPPDSGLGGLNGELPLILALIAFSVHSAHAAWYFSHYFNGMFWPHQLDNGRGEQRGMIVRVWCWPPYSTKEMLTHYEEGGLGNILP